MKIVLTAGLRYVRRMTLSAVTFVWTSPALAAEAEHGAEHGGGGLPQFNAEWFPSQIFWLAVTFAVLFVFFSKRALPAIEQTLAARAQKVEDDRATATQLASQAQEIRDSYERDMNKAREKSSDVLRATDAKIKEKASDMLYSYRTKFTQEIARTEDELASIRASLVGSMNAVAAEIAAQATSDILATSTDMDQAKIIVETLNKQKVAA